MALGTEVGPGAGHLVLDRDPALLPKRGVAAQFSAHVYCGQMVGWIKLPLGTEVGLGPDDTMLDGDPQKGAQRYDCPVYDCPDFECLD